MLLISMKGMVNSVYKREGATSPQTSACSLSAYHKVTPRFRQAEIISAASHLHNGLGRDALDVLRVEAVAGQNLRRGAAREAWK